uniref:Epg5-like central TPR repeats domain-containing protein n=1 Tax=Aceria tosichella TaxID=561515 RepID=A0A6G1SCM6_9ACAR
MNPPHERQSSISNNSDAENEHFHLAESLISWMEYFKTTREDDPDRALSSILSSATSRLHQTSPPIVAWNLVNIFGRKQGCEKLLTALSTAEYKDEFNSNSQLGPDVIEKSSNENIRSYLHRNDKEILAIVSEYTTVSSIQIDALESTVIHEDNVRQLINNPERKQSVICLLLSWLGDHNNYRHLNGFYYAANHLLKTILETSPITEQVDLYNCILIDVCLAHPGSVQVFSPYLSPCSCSAQCFLDLYKTICSKQVILGPMATFVLLSKFDIKSWLNINSVESKKGYHELIVTTCSAFKDIGKEPDKSYELTMDLFRRHLQIELAAPIRDKPDELFLVLGQFLNLMDEQVLAPNLWLDFLIIIGLNHDPKQEDCCKMTSITENVARLAECQTIFDHHSLCVLVQSISEYLKHRYESNGVTLLQLYQDYIEQYGVVMLSVTFMWIKSTSDAMLVDKNDLIWKQFLGMWVEWVLPPATCNNKPNFNLMVNCFVFSLQYMIHKMPDCAQSILGYLLSELTSYVGKLKDDLKMELTILQRCLKNLPWSSMLATQTDLENLAFLSEHTEHNMSDLVSYIMLQINIKESLAKLEQASTESSVMAQSVEHLSNIIISQYEHLQGIQLPDNHLCAMDTNSIPKLASSMLARAEFLDTEGDELLFKLLKYICMGKNDLNTIVGLDGSHQVDNQSGQTTTTTLTFDSIERAVIYARFVSDYLVDLIRRKPTLVQQTNLKPLTKVINNSLMDLEPVLQSDGLNMEQRKILYATLLKCCNCDALDGNSRLILARLFAESNSMKNKPSLVVDMLQSIGQFLRDPKILVNMVEALVDLYFSITGHYDDVCKCFYLSSIQIDLYLDSCIRERSPMALMIYYESQLACTFNQPSINGLGANPDPSLTTPSAELCRDRTQLWPSYLFWLSRLIHRLSKRPSATTLISVSAHKVTTILIRLLIMLESDLEQFVLRDCLSDGNSGQQHSNLSHLDHVGLTESMSGENLNGLEQREEHDQCSIANNSTVLAVAAAAACPPKSSTRPTMANLSSEHKCLLGLIKQLTSFYDSINSGGLWSYLKSSNKSEQSIKISITSLTVACFLADRSLLHLSNLPLESPAHLEMLRDELAKLRRVCLTKLEALRRSKSSIDYSQFLDSFIESVQQNIKVQYCEVVQLITTFELAH